MNSYNMNIYQWRKHMAKKHASRPWIVYGEKHPKVKAGIENHVALCFTPDRKEVLKLIRNLQRVSDWRQAVLAFQLLVNILKYHKSDRLWLMVTKEFGAFVRKYNDRIIKD